jgi:thiamine kinase-like enzyme
MTSDFDEMLRGVVTSTAEPGGAELASVLEETLVDRGVAGDQFNNVAIERLKSRVYRLRVEANGRSTSLVLKRYDPWLARRNELVVRRWLPALGMSDRSPQLLATAADRHGESVWHVYEDLGNGAVDRDRRNSEALKAVVDLIAELHTRAAGHVLLPLCRHYCGDLGAPFFAANVRDAIAVLEDLVPGRVELTSERCALRDRLLVRLYQLRNELPWRVHLLQCAGGPDTLLHGDLWTTNTFVAATSHGPAARFIDWDHAAVGPATYDLSTFLYRFPASERRWILEAYATAVGRAGWRLPPDPDLNALFETAEYARYANRVIWPAAALLEERTEWGWVMLDEVERWFVAMAPALAA